MAPRCLAQPIDGYDGHQGWPDKRSPSSIDLPQTPHNVDLLLSLTHLTGEPLKQKELKEETHLGFLW